MVKAKKIKNGLKLIGCERTRGVIYQTITLKKLYHKLAYCARLQTRRSRARLTTQTTGAIIRNRGLARGDATSVQKQQIIMMRNTRVPSQTDWFELPFYLYFAFLISSRN